jgi:hypothetical protein
MSSIETFKEPTSSEFMHQSAHVNHLLALRNAYTRKTNFPYGLC